MNRAARLAGESAWRPVGSARCAFNLLDSRRRRFTNVRIAIAEQGLQRRRRLDRNGRDETRYLRPIQEIISRDITPADELLEKFRGPWGGSVAPVFEEYAY